MATATEAACVLGKRDASALGEAPAAAAPQAAVVDFAAFLADPSSAEACAACEALAASLRDTGIVLLRDPRVTMDDQGKFLDMMEDYFDQPDEAKMPDVRPELHYQVGATPSKVEIPICKSDDECLARIKTMPEKDKPTEITGADPKWRFFWRIGERPKEGGFEALNAEPVVPKAFPQWTTKMDAWGGLMLQAVTTCAEMAALGFDLPRDAFSSLMHMGPHLLAPTGSDLSRHRDVGTVLAGWHNDLNLFTIHGKSRYPGLSVWLKDGTKMGVKIPDGCLLVQAGMQIERLTGGVVQAVSAHARAPPTPARPHPSPRPPLPARARPPTPPSRVCFSAHPLAPLAAVVQGMHEVVITDATVTAAKKQEEAGRPQWRISSTLFAHVASAKELVPLGSFATPEALAEYPSITAGEQVVQVLQKINLAKPEA
jgi:isopenicillin N synthase-like dioxygenase